MTSITKSEIFNRNLSNTNLTKRQRAGKRQWFGVPKKVRQAHVRMMVKARFAKMTAEERSEMGRKMILTRWEKYRASKNQ
jgi:hypothetical protein